MGMFSGLFGGGGSAKRAAALEARKAAEARAELLKRVETEQKRYDPYTAAGERAIGQYETALGGLEGRISGIDPRIEELYAERAALQPQVSEMYTLAQQQDPILQKLISGDVDLYKETPGYEFRRREGQKALCVCG